MDMTNTPKFEDVLKIALTKQELAMNEICLRLTETEANIRKIDPNSIKEMINDIAQIIIHDKAKEVSEKMDNIKGSQLSSEKAAESLKEEIMKMDERFKKDIENKIEKKDLNTTKAKLEKRLTDLARKLRGINSPNTPDNDEWLPFIMYNSKCFFCNQEVKCKLLSIHSITKINRTMQF